MASKRVRRSKQQRRVSRREPARAIDRRQFVRTAGGVLVAAGLGCSASDGTTGTTVQGTLDLTIHGLDASAATGGRVVVTPTSGSAVTVDIPAAGHQTQLLPVGSASVTYTPPANHNVVGSVPATVTITANTVTPVVINLAYVAPGTTGTIQVTVTGLTGSATSTATATRTDVAGSPITINVSAAGSGSNSVIPAGTYSITYNPPSGFTVNTTNPVTGKVVTVGGTTPVTFTVQASTVPPAVIFHADWSTATGHTDAALRDTGKTLPFDQANGNPNPTGGSGVMEVVSASGHGFPQGMANILRVTRNNQDTYGVVNIGSTSFHWNQLAVGDANYWRVYLRVDIPDSEGDIAQLSSNAGISHHPIEFPAGGGIYEPTNFFSTPDGQMAYDAYTDTANTFPRNRAICGAFVDPAHYGQRLPKQTVLRFEWMIRRDTTSGYSMYIRIYDATNEASGGTGVLMWSEDGVGASHGAMTTETGSGTTMKSNDGLYTVTSLDTYRSMQVGENGGWHSYSQDVYFYWGGLCLRSDTWCGPYSGGI